MKINDIDIKTKITQRSRNLRHKEPCHKIKTKNIYNIVFIKEQEYILKIKFTVIMLSFS